MYTVKLQNVNTASSPHVDTCTSADFKKTKQANIYTEGLLNTNKFSITDGRE